ncbi:MAG TPA: hypothetical protein VLA25_01920, partial [Methylotenera sp.]|nr:hypothetical protein [Methylotenera sp.]
MTSKTVAYPFLTDATEPSEVLAYMMRVGPGKTVLEIAGASGENAIMMAFAGAAKVYMNDI